MKKLTYKQAYDKIIEAYFKDEIKPFNPYFCFCGTLSPDNNWGNTYFAKKYLPSRYPYTINEYGRMEKALFSKLPNTQWLDTGLVSYPGDEDSYMQTTIKYEEKLFEGMCAALEVLKQIHIERGEVIEEDLPFTKRQLQIV